MDCCSVSSGSLPCTQGEGEEGGSGPAGQGGPGSLLRQVHRGVSSNLSGGRSSLGLFSVKVPCLSL